MIIHKLIFRELFGNFIVALLSLSVILFMEKFVRLTKLIMGRGANPIDIMKVFLYLQPSILLLAIPMALLISIFLTYGRMAADNEIVVLKSSGMSFPGISGAAVSVSVLGFLALLFISLYLSPVSMRSFKETLNEAITKKASLALEEETFSTVFKDTVIYVKDMPAENKFNGIFIYSDAGTPFKKPVVIVAEDGAISSNLSEGTIQLSMHNGMIHAYDDDSSSEITFSEYDFVLASGISTVSASKPAEVETPKLWEGRDRDISWKIELNRRLAIPFAALIFGFLGPALSSRAGRIGRLGNFSISLVILMFYYLFLIMGEGLAKAQKIPPFLSGWGPDIFFGIVAVIFYYVAYKDKPIIAHHPL
ncbi:MAG: LPS export ABC transporter permease LptF [Nitrospirae bacterium]|nr:LPS export ABC transporter permease LptF [Nitrospirota bacterium]